MLEKVERTNRGFEIIKFKDYDGEDCALQQSSLALYEQPGTSAIWIGRDDDMMHLSLEQVEELIGALQNWVNEGTFTSAQQARQADAPSSPLGKAGSGAVVFVPSRFSFPFDMPVFLEVSPLVTDDHIIYTGDPETHFPNKPGVYSCDVTIVDHDGGLQLTNFKPFDYQAAPNNGFEPTEQSSGAKQKSVSAAQAD